jgi:hypothetical protein
MAFNPETIEPHTFIAKQAYLKGLMDAVLFIERDRVDCLEALKEDQDFNE